MQLKRIRKNHKKEILIGGLIVVCVISAITITTTRAKYKLTEDLELASGTINYKPYDFKVMAMYKSDDKTNYTEINEMPASGYIINESKSYCNKSDGNKNTTAVLKTIDGNHTIGKLKKNDRCYLYFDKELKGSEAILGNVTVNTGSPNFVNVATTNEGVYKVSDSVYGGDSYYFRGAVTNNYVKFGDFCWRIIRINGDGSIRLIYDGATCHANGTKTAESIAVSNVAYNTNYNQSNYIGWTYSGTSQRPSDNNAATASNAKTQLEIWYSTNITEANASKLAEGKFCNDRDVDSKYTWKITGSTFYYAARTRLYTDYTPTLSCPTGDVYSLKVGLITADEVAMTGAKHGAGNTSYYLYNGQNYWTMSPSYWNMGGSFCVDESGCTTIPPNALMLNINASGQISETKVSELYNLRPVINLKSNITFSSGNGTINNPYIVE